MTKKDYLAIGKALRVVVHTPDPDGSLSDMYIAIASAIADVFAEDNPRFNRTRFLRFVETGADHK